MTPDESVLSDAETHLVDEVAASVAEDFEDPQLRQATRAAFLAVHRWGVDLERDVGEQEFAAFDVALREACDDIRRRQVVTVERVEVSLEDAALFVVEHSEENAGWDRHEPGGLVERVEDGGRP